MTMRIVILRASSLGLFVAGAAPALAAPEMQRTAAVEVQYRDLNLATDDGQTRLDGRIRRAARESCGTVGRGIAAQRADELCRAIAIADAHAQAVPLIDAARRGEFDRLAQNGTTLSVRAR